MNTSGGSAVYTARSSQPAVAPTGIPATSYLRRAQTQDAAERIKRVMGADVERSSLTHQQIADRLGVSVSTVHDWLAPTKPQCIPSRYVPAWCAAVDSDELVLLMAPRLRPLVDLARVVVERQRLDRRIEELKALAEAA